MEHAERLRPAQLSYLAIFCPRLGTTEETFRDQAVFYYSRKTKSKRRHSPNHERIISNEDDHLQQENDNEKLRQIGLAQAIVDFAQNFSAGKPVESVETDKTRTVIHQLEQDWWLVASIDLTRIPLGKASTEKNTSSAAIETEARFEYSSREVAPPDLLLHNIKRAQSLFTLHHGSSLDGLFTWLGRTTFCSTLGRFWTWFANDWNVLLHGNPSVDIFNGVKLAAGGELGIGVGEEEWGSGEREVLEHFVTSTNGLIDVLVARFGDDRPTQQPLGSQPKTQEKYSPWVGSGNYPDASDGVIFSGVKALQAQSRHDVSEWVQSIYTHGDFAYGVRSNPISDRRKRQRRKAEARNTYGSTPNSAQSPGLKSREATSSSPARKLNVKNDDRPSIPPPIVSAANVSLKNATANIKSQERQQSTAETTGDRSSFADPQIWMNVLTLGYGSSWTFSGKDTPLASSDQEVAARKGQRRNVRSSHSEDVNKDATSPVKKSSRSVEEAIKLRQDREEKGYFMIGYQGDLERDKKIAAESEASETSADQSLAGDLQSSNGRLSLRTIYVKLNKGAGNKLQKMRLSSWLDKNKNASNKEKTSMQRIRVRVAVFVHRPFIFTLLFEADSPSLSFPTFYQDIYNYLSPLQRSLSLRTSPSRAALRTHDQLTTRFLSPAAYSLASSTPKRPIYDLVYNPMSLAIHSSLPNVPEPGSMSIDPTGEKWTRADALNVHSQILAMCSAAEAPDSTSFERLVKTGRGWWVVWMRITTTAAEDLAAEDDAEDAEDAKFVGDAEGEGIHERNEENMEETLTDRNHGEADMANATNSDERTSNEEGTAASGKQSYAITGRSGNGRKGIYNRKPPTISPSIREAILVRRARDHALSGESERSEPSIFGFGGRRRPRSDADGARAGAGGRNENGGEGSGEGTMSARLVEGIGIDARKYVEGLLSFNR